MKLAEALLERKGAEVKIDSLQERLEENAARAGRRHAGRGAGVVGGRVARGPRGASRR